MAVQVNRFDIKIKEGLKKNINNTLNAVGIYVEGEAKKLCPVDTGALRASLTYDVNAEQEMTRIGSNMDYALKIEKGGSRQAPDGYLTPAAENNIEEIKNIMAQYMKME